MKFLHNFVLNFHSWYKMTAIWHGWLLWCQFLVCSLLKTCTGQLRVRLWMLTFCPKRNNLKLDYKKLHLCHVMPYEFRKGISVGTATENIQTVMLFQQSRRGSSGWFKPELSTTPRMTFRRGWRTSAYHSGEWTETFDEKVC